ncbi:MAG TPA: M28 family peptidase [Bacillota bacterium]|nr:M28 family peptidase [Bacillota bacterium]
MLRQHVEHLARVIGPRVSAGEGEKRAADYCRATLEHAGYHVEVQPFRALTTFSWLHIVFFLWPLVAWLVRAPLAGFLGAVLFLLDLNTIQVLSRLFPKGQSQNVYARRHSVPASESPIILVAHLDSSKAGLNFSPAMVKGFRSSFLLMVGSICSAPILLLMSNAGYLPRVVALLPCLYLAFASLTLFHREFWNNVTPGANDNASGVAAVLHIASTPELLPEDKDIRILFTGCEEAGTYGMSNFLREHGAEVRNARFINLDNIGAGSLFYMSGEGMFPVFKATAELIEACRLTAEENPRLGVRQGVYTLLSTDAMPALVRGYKAVSFLAVDDQGLLPNWHWPTDTVENVDFGTVETAVSFVSALIKRI